MSVASKPYDFFLGALGSVGGPANGSFDDAVVDSDFCVRYKVLRYLGLTDFLANNLSKRNFYLKYFCAS